MGEYGDNRLTHGERALAALLETFKPNLTTSDQDLIVKGLDCLPSRAVSKAVADFQGLTGWVRNKFWLGKMPVIDELLTRVRECENEFSQIDTKIKREALPPPKTFKKSNESNRRALVQKLIGDGSEHSISLAQARLEMNSKHATLPKRPDGTTASQFDGEQWFTRRTISR